ncbi:MAG: hypothetical protein O7G85_04910 [Planctomycetota bacterium]|nr:hypothetical protein [Planctomycetota bacterium]
MNDDHRTRNRLFVFIAIMMLIVGGHWFLNRTSTQEALEASADVIAPGPDHWQRNLNAIDEAQQVTQLINARQSLAGKYHD